MRSLIKQLKLTANRWLLINLISISKVRHVVHMVARGMQLVNVLEGGSLVQDLAEKGNAIHRKAQNDREHEINLLPGSRLASITGQLTVVVTRVYENGNLWVQGQKMLTLNQGEEFLRVSGLIRPEDIKPGNVVDSDRVAQAQISYTGAGDVHDADKQNWFGRFFNMIAPI